MLSCVNWIVFTKSSHSAVVLLLLLQFGRSSHLRHTHSINFNVNTTHWNFSLDLPSSFVVIFFSLSSFRFRFSSLYHSLAYSYGVDLQFIRCIFGIWVFSFLFIFDWNPKRNKYTHPFGVLHSKYLYIFIGTNIKSEKRSKKTKKKKKKVSSVLIVYILCVCRQCIYAVSPRTHIHRDTARTPTRTAYAYHATTSHHHQIHSYHGGKRSPNRRIEDEAEAEAAAVIVVVVGKKHTNCTYSWCVSGEQLWCSQCVYHIIHYICCFFFKFFFSGEFGRMDIIQWRCYRRCRLQSCFWRQSVWQYYCDTLHGVSAIHLHPPLSSRTNIYSNQTKRSKSISGVCVSAAANYEWIVWWDRKCNWLIKNGKWLSTGWRGLDDVVEIKTKTIHKRDIRSKLTRRNDSNKWKICFLALFEQVRDTKLTKRQIYTNTRSELILLFIVRSIYSIFVYIHATHHTTPPHISLCCVSSRCFALTSSSSSAEYDDN